MNWEKVDPLSDSGLITFVLANTEAQVSKNGDVWLCAADDPNMSHGFSVQNLSKFILALQQLKQEALLRFGEEWGK